MEASLDVTSMSGVVALSPVLMSGVNEASGTLSVIVNSGLECVAATAEHKHQQSSLQSVLRWE